MGYSPSDARILAFFILCFLVFIGSIVAEVIISLKWDKKKRAQIATLDDVAEYSRERKKVTLIPIFIYIFILAAAVFLLEYYYPQMQVIRTMLSNRILSILFIPVAIFLICTLFGLITSKVLTAEGKATPLPPKIECTKLDMPCKIIVSASHALQAEVFLNGHKAGALKKGQALEVETEYAENQIVIILNHYTIQREFNFSAASNCTKKISFDAKAFIFIEGVNEKKPQSITANNSEALSLSEDILTLPRNLSKEMKIVKKMDKRIKRASGIVVFAAVTSIMLGVFLPFLPYVWLEQVAILDSVDNTFLILTGLLYLGISVIVNRRSRACLILAGCILAIDAVFLLIIGGREALALYYILSGVIVAGLIYGGIYSVRYHAITKEYSRIYGSEMAALIQDNKPKTGNTRIALYAVVGCVGIGASIIYSFVGGAYPNVRDFDDWIEYTSGVATVRMPSPHVNEASTPLQCCPGAVFYSAQSESYPVSVVLMTLSDKLKVLGIAADDTDRLESVLASELDFYINALEASITIRSSGYMAGNVRYLEAGVVVHDGYPGAFRAFSGGDDVYIVGIIVRQDNGDIFSRFFESITVK